MKPLTVCGWRGKKRRGGAEDSDAPVPFKLNAVKQKGEQ